MDTLAQFFWLTVYKCCASLLVESVKYWQLNTVEDSSIEILFQYLFGVTFV